MSKLNIVSDAINNTTSNTANISVNSTSGCLLESNE